MAQTLIQVKDLKKYYNGGDVKALDGVTVDVYKGDVNAVIGPSCAAVPKRCVVPLQSPEPRSTSQTALDHTDNGLCLICNANLDFPSNNLYS